MRSSYEIDGFGFFTSTGGFGGADEGGFFSVRASFLSWRSDCFCCFSSLSFFNRCCSKRTYEIDLLFFRKLILTSEFLLFYFSTSALFENGLNSSTIHRLRFVQFLL